MFIQVIEGKVRDSKALDRQLERWERELMSGAVGYLGSTSGCTSNGDCCLVARFESREAAQRNSARPEQTAWWKETEQCFVGPVTFHDSEEVQVMSHGDLDTARFVQVMDGHVADRRRAEQLEREAEPMLAKYRPELLGSVLAFFDGDEFTEIAYFTSEADARRGEHMEVPAEVRSMVSAWEQTLKVDHYYDIAQPRLTHA